MDIREFIEARLVEKEYRATKTFVEVAGIFNPLETQILAEVRAIRDILELHKQWTVVLDTPMKVEPSVFDDYDPNTWTWKASQEVMLLTEQKYRDYFGAEPPTSPMVRAIARVWKDHPDYQKEWI